MNTDQDQTRAWQMAEHDGDPDAADLAFASLARQWPRASVPSGLARRVAGLAPVAEGRRGWDWSVIGFRAAVASALALSGMVLGSVSGQTLGGLFLASLQAVAVGVGTLLALAGGWWRLVAAVGVPMVRVADAVARVLAEPLPLFVLLVNVLIASAAFAALRRLMAVREV